MKKRYNLSLDQKEVEQFKKDNPDKKLSSFLNEKLKEENKKDK